LLLQLLARNSCPLLKRRQGANKANWPNAKLFIDNDVDAWIDLDFLVLSFFAVRIG
jgi:hypothetical protein